MSAAKAASSQNHKTMLGAPLQWIDVSAPNAKSKAAKATEAISRTRMPETEKNTSIHDAFAGLILGFGVVAAVFSSVVLVALSVGAISLPFR
jgi:hypothetical protein